MGEYYNNSGKYQYLYNDPKKLVSNLPESGDFDLILDLLSKYEFLYEYNYESVLESVTVSEVDDPYNNSPFPIRAIEMTEYELSSSMHEILLWCTKHDLIKKYDVENFLHSVLKYINGGDEDYDITEACRYFVEDLLDRIFERYGVSNSN